MPFLMVLFGCWLLKSLRGMSRVCELWAFLTPTASYWIGVPFAPSGTYCGPRGRDKCERIKITDRQTWVDGANTMLNDTQGTIHYLMHRAKVFIANAKSMDVSGWYSKKWKTSVLKLYQFVPYPHLWPKKRNKEILCLEQTFLWKPTRQVLVLSRGKMKHIIKCSYLFIVTSGHRQHEMNNWFTFIYQDIRCLTKGCCHSRTMS